MGTRGEGTHYAYPKVVRSSFRDSLLWILNVRIRFESRGWDSIYESCFGPLIKDSSFPHSRAGPYLGILLDSWCMTTVFKMVNNSVDAFTSNLQGWG
jgi:hypothetical protein